MGHLGMNKMQALARSFVWWPREDTARACNGCQQTQRTPQTAPLHPWEWPAQPWQRIHIDYAGQFLEQMWLIVVDAHSKWPEVIPMSTTTATQTIKTLRKLSAQFGIPSNW